MQLVVSQRDRLVAAVMDALPAGIPGSSVALRGSLATGTSDLYSDVDLLWEVPDPRFMAAVAVLPRLLAAVLPVESIRWEPELRRSERHRLAFVQFRQLPLFWRLDLEIFAESVGRDSAVDVDPAAPPPADWSLPQSALMNVVAAAKAILRSRPKEADALLDRAYLRLGLERERGALARQARALAHRIGREHPEVSVLAARTQQLLEALLPPSPAIGERSADEPG
jgi:hypothetical protein